MNTFPAPTRTDSAPPRRSWRLVALGVLLGLVLSAGVVVGGGYVLLSLFNPVGDEYVCSDGEVPGGAAPVAPGEGNACYLPGEIPKGFEADPFGNRPMSYNCDKDGWRLVEKTSGRGAGEVTECISDDTDLPAGWKLGDE